MVAAAQYEGAFLIFLGELWMFYLISRQEGGDATHLGHSSQFSPGSNLYKVWLE